MVPQCGDVLGAVVAVITIPHPVTPSAHFILDCSVQRSWVKQCLFLELIAVLQRLLFLAVSLVDVTFESVFGWTELITILAIVSITLEMPALHMVAHSCLILGGEATLSTSPGAIKLLHHSHLNRFLQLAWTRAGILRLGCEDSPLQLLQLGNQKHV